MVGMFLHHRQRSYWCVRYIEAGSCSALGSLIALVNVVEAMIVLPDHVIIFAEACLVISNYTLICSER